MSPLFINAAPLRFSLKLYQKDLDNTLRHGGPLFCHAGNNK